MKRVSGIFVLSAVFATSATAALADVINLGSFATGTTAGALGFSASQTAMNFAGYTAFASPPAVAVAPALQNGTASTYALSPAPYWAGPMGNSTWVGYASGAGPSGTIQPPYGYYQFNTQFTAFEPSALYGGTISVMGDDTVEVLLNGNVIVPFGLLGSDARCADAGPNCRGADTVALGGLTLLGGTDANTLTFIVEQAGWIGPAGDPSGMDFTANLSAPEPASLILLGTGLAGAACMLRRRRRIA